jgi:hypothetical protein
MPSAPLVITWPGGIGNPIGEQIPVSGGRRLRSSRRSKTRKSKRSSRSTRRNRRSGMRKNTRRRA